MKKRLLSAFLALTMALTLTPTLALADEPEAAEPEELVVDLTDEVESGDDLLLQDFYGGGGIQILGEIGSNSSYNTLNTQQRKLYSDLRAWIQTLNKQESDTSTEYKFTVNSQSEYDAVWNNAITNGNFRAITTCLMHDLPGDFYWYARQTSMSSYGYEITISFLVADEYKVSDYVVSGAQLQRAHRAVDNAEKIVADASGLDDYRKLTHYRERICSLVDYNHSAAALPDSGVTIADPWALVSVFDGDASTKVVCEGYSKAFQYLCDMSSWTGEVECYTVSGAMDGGGHMWNIVRIDGNNYLTDITNCDTGSVGYPDKLFLAGATGSVTNGYYPSDPSDSQTSKILYTYDEDSPASNSILTLSSTKYVYTPPATIQGTVTITGDLQMGNTLTATYNRASSDPPGTPSYQWYRGSTAISGATKQTYQTTAADVNARIHCVITIGSSTKASNSVTITPGPAGTAVIPAVEADPAASGAAQGTIRVKNTLTTQEYAVIPQQSAAADLSWRSGNGGDLLFTVPVNTPHYVYTRVKATASTAAGSAMVCGDPVTVVPTAALRTPTAEEFTFTAPASLVYDGTSKADAVRSGVASTIHNGHYTVTFTDAQGASVSDPNHAGTYRVLVSVAAHDNYSAASNILLGTVTIAKATPDFSIQGVTSVRVGGSTVLTVTGLPAGLTISNWTAQPSGTVTLQPSQDRMSATITAGLATGSTTVTASTPGNDDYNARSVNVQVTVSSKSAQTIAFTSPASQVLELDKTLNNPAVVTVPASGGGAVTYTSSNPAVATVDANGVVKALRTGTTTITATAAETADYAPASVSYQLTVTGRDLTSVIEATVTGTYTYDGTAKRPTVQVKDTSTGTVLTEGRDYTLSYQNNVNAGTNASVTVTPVAGSGYSWTAKTVYFTINKAVHPGVSVVETYNYDTAARIEISPDRILTNRGISTGTQYTAASISGSTSIIGNKREGLVNGRLVLYTTLADGRPGDEATFIFTVQHQNYEDFNITYTLRLVSLPIQDPVDCVMDWRLDSNGSSYTVTISSRRNAEYRFNGGSWSSQNTRTGLNGGVLVTGYIRARGVDGVSQPSDERSASLVTPPIFSINGGAISGTRRLTLSVASGSTIYYSTDGSQPTQNRAYRYTDPFEVSPGTRVLAFAVTEDGRVSDTRSVNFYSPSSSSGSGSSGSSGSSGGSSSRTYAISSSSTTGGSVSLSKSNASAGQNITITPRPQAGYVLDTLKVFDQNGREISTRQSGSTYTFTMPAGKVMIDATFRASSSAGTTPVEDTTPQTPPASTNKTFSDVASGYWAKDAIDWASGNGYMNGTSSTAFNPGGTVTRQQLWMILARISGENPSNMAAARVWAISNGISDGSDGGSNMSRQQMVTFLYRYCAMRNLAVSGSGSLSGFPDQGSVSGYAKDALAWAVGNGIVTGTSTGALNPGGTATRAQFAVILKRFSDHFGGRI